MRLEKRGFEQVLGTFRSFDLLATRQGGVRRHCRHRPLARWIHLARELGLTRGQVDDLGLLGLWLGLACCYRLAVGLGPVGVAPHEGADIVVAHRDSRVRVHGEPHERVRAVLLVQHRLDAECPRFDDHALHVLVGDVEAQLQLCVELLPRVLVLREDDLPSWTTRETLAEDVLDTFPCHVAPFRASWMDESLPILQSKPQKSNLLFDHQSQKC